MKEFIFKTSALILASCLVLTGCGKLKSDKNTKPNQATKASAETSRPGKQPNLGLTDQEFVNRYKKFAKAFKLDDMNISPLTTFARIPDEGKSIAMTRHFAVVLFLDTDKKNVSTARIGIKDPTRLESIYELQDDVATAIIAAIPTIKDPIHIGKEVSVMLSDAEQTKSNKLTLVGSYLIDDYKVLVFKEGRKILFFDITHPNYKI